MIRPCHSFPRNTWVSALPWGTATASGYSVRIFGFGLPVLEIQEVILCVICVSFKNSLFFEANYRFDKHSGFHVCLAKTFSITLCWRTQVWFKRWAAQKTDWILISSILVFFRIHHGKSNEASLQYKVLRVLNRYKNSNDMFILKLKVNGLSNTVLVIRLSGFLWKVSLRSERYTMYRKKSLINRTLSSSEINSFRCKI